MLRVKSIVFYQIASWPQAMIEKFALKIHSLVYPLSPEETDEMMNWWGPCASFRLFLTVSNVTVIFTMCPM